jgi:YbgC/YbaW family acyl-CoA thioester hydrolase
MPSRFKITRTVEFHETDLAGIMHFSNYFRWMEACEMAFFRSLGLPVVTRRGDAMTGWPRVGVSCDYRAPLRFGDRVEVRLYVKEIRTRALTLVFQFRRLAPGGGAAELAAGGEMTTVCATMHPRTGRAASRTIPAAVRAKLSVAPARLRGA